MPPKFSGSIVAKTLWKQTAAALMTAGRNLVRIECLLTKQSPNDFIFEEIYVLKQHTNETPVTFD